MWFFADLHNFHLYKDYLISWTSFESFSVSKKSHQEKKKIRKNKVSFTLQPKENMAKLTVYLLSFS